MNVFTTTPFLEIAGEVFFPGRARTIELFEVEGRPLRLLVLDGRKPVRSMPFYDYPQPLTHLTEPARPLGYFPRTVVRTMPVEERTPEPTGFLPSPYIEWAKFPDWASFEARASMKAFGSNDRQRRKLQRDLGPLKFELDDRRPEVFDACVRWKSAQYLATGLTDMFAAPANVELFRRLQQRGIVAVSSLSAGETLLAAHFGSVTDRRLTWWVPAYDPAYSKYSAGRLMLEELMRASQARGDLEFDFLIGDEAYKFAYATHNRVIGPVGTPPLVEQLLAETKRRAKAVLSRYPIAYDFARKVERRLRQRA